MIVTAIMPTRGRPQFAPAALECFRSQDWPQKELIIVDDRDAPSFAEPPKGAQYIQLPRRYTIGAKRNLAISRAAGEVIVHFDDDDWSAPNRIADQVNRLLESGADVTGYNVLTYDYGGQRWQYRGASRYAVGCTLCYRRDYWQHHPFKDQDVGEDNDFVYAARRIVTADAGGLMLARIHPANISDKRPALGKCAAWQRIA